MTALEVIQQKEQRLWQDVKTCEDGIDHAKPRTPNQEFWTEHLALTTARWVVAHDLVEAVKLELKRINRKPSPTRNTSCLSFVAL